MQRMRRCRAGRFAYRRRSRSKALSFKLNKTKNDFQYRSSIRRRYKRDLGVSEENARCHVLALGNRTSCLVRDCSWKDQHRRAFLVCRPRSLDVGLLSACLPTYLHVYCCSMTCHNFSIVQFSRVRRQCLICTVLETSVDDLSDVTTWAFLNSQRVLE